MAFEKQCTNVQTAQHFKHYPDGSQLMAQEMQFVQTMRVDAAWHGESEECTKKSLHNCNGTSSQSNTSTRETVNEITQTDDAPAFFLSLLFAFVIYSCCRLSFSVSLCGNFIYCIRLHVAGGELWRKEREREREMSTECARSQLIITHVRNEKLRIKCLACIMLMTDGNGAAATLPRLDAYRRFITN